MKAIVAVDQQWGIGYKGELLQRIPEDMKFFKQTTINKVVIMGRGTYDSLPGKEPLKDRINIVLSKSLSDERVIVCRSLDEILTEMKKYNTDDLFVIGGESVFRLLLPYCTEAYVTKIYKTYPADKYFENMDENKEWTLTSEEELRTYQDIFFRFSRYSKR
ncbi:MAG: dihydrofolate reductase [Peptococcaceae bacterium]|nr:dihydrofolate reductase [Peptococcaceae bacterium]